MSIDSVSSDYSAMSDRWRTARDCVEGAWAIKRAGQRYLPPLAGHNPNNPNDRYWSYVQRALFYGAVGRTVDGLVGMCFRRPPVVDSPPGSEELRADIDLMGRPLEEFAKALLREVVTTGRAGVLVEHTVAPAAPRPYFRLYRTEDILDIVEDVIGGSVQPVQIRVRECYEQPKAGVEFESETIEQVRVLELVEGVYRQRLFRVSSDSGEYLPLEEAVPTIDVQPLDYIPFWTFATDHLARPGLIEPPPLMDMCEINLAHYREEADLRNALHVAGVPTLFISGVDPEDKTVKLGAEEAYFMAPADAKAYYVGYDATGASAIRNDLADLEQKLAFLGARMLQPDNRGIEAAETAQIHRQGEISILASIADGVNVRLTQAFQLLLEWALFPGYQDARIELNTDFVPAQAPSAMLAEMVRAWQAQAISHESLWQFMQTGELVNPQRTSAEEKKLITASPPPAVPTPGGGVANPNLGGSPVPTPPRTNGATQQGAG